MGREVRMVPPGWEHPKKDAVHFIPLYSGRDVQALQAEWDEDAAQWAKGCRKHWETGEWVDHHESCTFEEWYGPRPVESDYMPHWADGQATHFMMYEDTSEGTPISPAFATAEELARWLADNEASAFASMTATYDQWLATIKAGWAPSMVARGRSLDSGVAEMGRHE